MNQPVTVVTTRPTTDMPLGLYRVVDANQIYWGTYRVCRNWCGDVFVMEWET